MPADKIESIIAASIADIPGSETTPDPVVDAPADVVADPPADAAAVTDPPAADAVVDSAKPVVADPAVKVPVVEEDAFAKEHDLKAKDSLGRENRIPYSRVKAIADNKAKKEVDAFTATVHAPVLEKVKTYEARLENIKVVEHAMFEDKPRFLKMLQSIDGYSELLAQTFGGSAAAGGVAPARDGATAAGAGADDPEPQPDVKDDAGNPVGYSAEGLAKLRSWDRTQAAKLAEERLGKRLEPFETASKEAKARFQSEQAIATDLEKASKWDGFVENAADILDVLKLDRESAMKTGSALKHDLLSAYHHVVHGKMRADETRIREQVIKELQVAPRATAVASAAAARGSVVDPGVDPVTAAIQKSIAHLQR